MQTLDNQMRFVKPQACDAVLVYQDQAVDRARRSVLMRVDPEQRALVDPLREQELSFEELCQITGFSPAKLNSHLTMLELRGIIVKVPGGMYRAYL